MARILDPQTNTYAAAGVVFAIIGLVLACTPAWPLAWIPAAAAWRAGHRGLARALSGGPGLRTSCIGIGVSGAAMVWLFALSLVAIDYMTR